MSDGWCEKCDKPSLKDKIGHYTYLCGRHTLEEADKKRAEILSVINDPGITWKVRRALLRDKFGFAEILIDELVGKEEPASDY